MAWIKESIAKEFNAADKNHNGSLNFEELYAVTCKAYEHADLPKPDKESVRKSLYLNDKDKDKTLKLEEYTTMIMRYLDHLAEAEKKADEEAAKKAEDDARHKKPEGDDKKKKSEEDAKKK